MNVYEKLLINFFGTTDSIEEAGYILTDGTLIDLSGRHFIDDPIERKYYLGNNVIQHHDIFGVNYCGFSLTDFWPHAYDKTFQPVKEILEKTRAISLKTDHSKYTLECWIRMMYPPTQQQYSVILKHFEEGRANVSYIDPSGYIIDDIYIPFLTAGKLKSFVESCKYKKPTNTPFSTASSFDKNVVCSPLKSDCLPMIRLDKYRELRARQQTYQDPHNTRQQKDYK